MTQPIETTDPVQAHVFTATLTAANVQLDDNGHPVIFVPNLLRNGHVAVGVWNSAGTTPNVTLRASDDMILIHPNGDTGFPWTLTVAGEMHP